MQISVLLGTFWSEFCLKMLMILPPTVLGGKKLEKRDKKGKERMGAAKKGGG